MSKPCCHVKDCKNELPSKPIMALCHEHLMKWRQIQIKENRINLYDREGTERFIRFKTYGN